MSAAVSRADMCRGEVCDLLLQQRPLQLERWNDAQVHMPATVPRRALPEKPLCQLLSTRRKLHCRCHRPSGLQVRTTNSFSILCLQQPPSDTELYCCFLVARRTGWAKDVTRRVENVTTFAETVLLVTSKKAEPIVSVCRVSPVSTAKAAKASAVAAITMELATSTAKEPNDAAVNPGKLNYFYSFLVSSASHTL